MAQKQIRQMTVDAHNLLMMDLPLRPAMVVDFGIDYNGSIQHSALQNAVRAGATPKELDDALGNGLKLSQLVKKYTDDDVFFETPYDMAIG